MAPVGGFRAFPISAAVAASAPIPDDTTANPDPMMHSIAKAALTFLGSGWKVGGLQGMFLHRSSALLDRFAPSAGGILPRLRLWKYVRLIAGAEEVIG
jgi:hypothetical protein